jgi:mycoredoxin
MAQSSSGSLHGLLRLMANTARGKNMESGIIVYGTTWCGACALVKRVLGEVGYDYEWIDIDKVPEAAELVIELNAGLRSVPTVLFPDGRVLVEPRRHELLAALGRN